MIKKQKKVTTHVSSSELNIGTPTLRVRQKNDEVNRKVYTLSRPMIDYCQRYRALGPVTSQLDIL